MLKLGQNAPQFSLKNHKGETVELHDFEGKWTVLYFYPKDNTSGCTKEAIDLHKEISTVIKLMKHSFPPEITLLNKCEASQKIIYGNRS